MINNCLGYTRFSSTYDRLPNDFFGVDFSSLDFLVRIGSIFSVSSSCCFTLTLVLPILQYQLVFTTSVNTCTLVFHRVCLFICEPRFPVLDCWWSPAPWLVWVASFQLVLWTTGWSLICCLWCRFDLFACWLLTCITYSWVDSILSYNLYICETLWRDGAWHKYGRAKFQSGSRSEGWSTNFGCTFFNIFNMFFNLSVVFSENNSWILLEKNWHIYGDTFLRVCTIWCRSKYIYRSCNLKCGFIRRPMCLVQ